MNISEFEPLLKKYQGRGPRYTSYPPANHFHHSFTGQDYQAAARAGNDEPMPRHLSLYVHVPFCQSLCYYCGCNKVITHNKNSCEQYLEYLYREMAMHARLYGSDRLVDQLHIGGGTPTFLANELLEELLETTAQLFHYNTPGKAQLSIEIDPRTIGVEEAAELIDIGFNRVSIGVQDLNPRVQAAINRKQSKSQVLDVIYGVRSAGVDSINFDLIYGLPLQTLASFKSTIQQTIDLQPDCIALYNYAHLPERNPAQRLINDDHLPDANTKLRMFMHAYQELTWAGYIYLGMDHFVRPNDPLAQAHKAKELDRNFQGYSCGASTDIVGMGLSAISRVGDCYAQNTTSLKDYRACLDGGGLPIVRGYHLDEDDLLRAGIIKNIMCQGEVNWRDLQPKLAVNPQSYFADEIVDLTSLAEDGLIDLHSKGFCLTNKGQFFQRAIAKVFDDFARGKGGAPIIEPIESAEVVQYSRGASYQPRTISARDKKSLL